MGMSSPAMPEYEELAAQREQDRIRNEAQKTQYVNYNSGLGGYSWNPETQTIDVNYNMPDKERLALIGSGIGDIDLNVTEATDKYFQNTLQNLQPQFDLYRSKVSSDLINKGIPVGSRAYNQVQEEMDKNITRELENAYDQKMQNLYDIYNAKQGSRSSAMGSTMGAIGTIGGGILGAYFGGPMGAMAGSSIGGAAGQAAGNMVSQ